MASSTLSGQDKDCASYLLSLKHRASPTMTEDDMNMIIERSSVSYMSSRPQSSEARTVSASSSFMSVTIPEPLFRTEEEISPNAVTMCRAGTHFSLPSFGGISDRTSFNSFGSYLSYPSNPRTLQEPKEPPVVLLPKLKANSTNNSQKKKSRTKPSLLDNGTDSANGTSTRDQPVCDKTLPILDLNDPRVLCQVVSDSDLLDAKDASFIPDYIFLSMAQLQPCFVKEVDRIGTYKTRKLGFKGMSCKHCGGEPGFGRYFPETLRSLSQTTTSQTIVKHVAYKCRKTPKDVKASVRILKERQDAKDQIAKEYRRSRFEERPKYGSRKVFFQRLWNRLHGDDEDSEQSTDGKRGKKNSHQGKRSSSSPTKGSRKAFKIKGKKTESKDQRGAMRGSDYNSITQLTSPRKRVVSYSSDDYNGENLPPVALKAE